MVEIARYVRNFLQGHQCKKGNDVKKAYMQFLRKDQKVFFGSAKERFQDTN